MCKNPEEKEKGLAQPSVLRADDCHKVPNVDGGHRANLKDVDRLSTVDVDVMLKLQDSDAIPEEPRETIPADEINNICHKY